MGGLFRPRMPGETIFHRGAEDRAVAAETRAEERAERERTAAEERAERERREANRRAAAETRARLQTRAGRRATLLTDERERLNRAGLLG